MTEEQIGLGIRKVKVKRPILWNSGIFPTSSLYGPLYIKDFFVSKTVHWQIETFLL